MVALSYYTAHSCCCCCCSEICNPISDIRIWNVKFMSAKRINIISMSSTHAQTPTGHSDTSPFPPAPTHLSLCFFLWVSFGLFALLVSCCLLVVMYSVSFPLFLFLFPYTLIIAASYAFIIASSSFSFSFLL